MIACASANYNCITGWQRLFILIYHHLVNVGDYIDALRLEKMAAILQTTFSNPFSWMKRYFDENFTDVCS